MATRQREDTVLEAKRTKIKPPPMFKVLLLNDDYTPMDFVVAVLQTLFLAEPENARRRSCSRCTATAWAFAAYIPRDVAATKVEQVKSYAKQHQHPLQCVMEEN